MPKRLLRDWTDSRPIHDAGEAGENLFTRLIMKADDFGRYIADPQLLRSLCYPYRDDLRNADMTRRLAACQEAGLIRCYEVCHTGATCWLSADELAGACAVGAKRYLVIPKFDQQLRATTSKYPPPPDDPSIPLPKAKNDDPCADAHGLRADAHGLRADDTHVRPYAEAHAQAKAHPPGPQGGGSDGGGFTPAFREFWDAVPARGRDRSSRKQAHAEWRKQGCADVADTVMAGLRAWVASEAWTKDSGQFVPGIHRWLRARKWTELPAVDGGDPLTAPPRAMTDAERILAFGPDTEAAA